MSFVCLFIFATVLALSFAAFNFAKVKKMDEGTDDMKEIASAIRLGSNTFINYEYRVLYTVVLVVAVIMAIATSWRQLLLCLSVLS